MWGISGLPFQLEKSAITHSIVKSNETRVPMLKIAHNACDQMYPNGAKNVVNVGWTHLEQIHCKNKNRAVAYQKCHCRELHHRCLQKFANLHMSVTHVHMDL